MRDILDPITKWWEADETFGLATVVQTFSSAPREPGAAMAVSASGEAVGSVSGGCVEGAVYELSTEVIASGERFAALGDVAAAVRTGTPVAVATIIEGPGAIGSRRIIWEGDQSDGTL